MAGVLTHGYPPSALNFCTERTVVSPARPLSRVPEERIT